ncbi:Putative Pol polyprotein from transposon element Bs1 [Triticum urartu]|uniref:Putative Pol polyprotein from transposon element Bs1 n=2 Tax=Triticum urartu TaxID=4572 RepID=M7Z8A0_TRIUA|nr:Putative Pol polyprotein from transposon element Bs1 [Triticum urartu]
MLSVHNEEETGITVAVGGNEPSGRYILVAGRADEKDGVRLPIPVGVLKSGITYRVAGWISLGEAQGTSHPVRIHLDVDDNGNETLVECGAVCAQEGAWTEIMGAFRLRTEPRSAAVYVHGAPAGVDIKVMDVRVFPVDHKARFRQLKDKTDKQWVKNLNKDQLRSAMQSRLQGLVSRYAGRFKHYDVNNEMLHGRFFRDRLGEEDIPAYMFKEVARLDPEPALFVNDYNVERANDPNATPEKYAEQVVWLQSCGAVVGGIGLQGHVQNPVGEVICAAIDRLAKTGVPIWFTELDVPEYDVSLRAKDLEVVLREAYAHPAVEGVVFWGFMQGTMWRENSWLVDADGTVNEAGQMFLNLQREWKTDARGSVDGDGDFKFRGFYGRYVVEVTTATGKQMLKTFTVEKGDNDTPLLVDLADA